MVQVFTLKSFSKINIFLKILHLRSDGFHELESLFQTIDLGDIIKLKKIKGKDDIVIFKSYHVDPNLNTVKKALQFLRVEAESKGYEMPFYEVEIDKKIPPGSGLGGGSANAAAVIWFLNKQHEFGLSLEEMAGIGQKIGSDVPFFFYGGLCLVKGRGEIVIPISKEVDFKLAVVVPKVSISTKIAYELWDRNKGHSLKEEPKLEEAIKQIEEKDFTKRSLFYNSFEKIILNNFEEVKAVFKEIEKLGFEPVLSGSGSAVYAVLHSDEDFEKIQFSLKSKGFNIFFAKTIKHGMMELT